MPRALRVAYILLHMKNGTSQPPEALQRELILEQFTKQAVPFSQAPSIRDQDALAMIIRLAQAGPGDIALDVGCGPGLLVCAIAAYVKHAVGVDVTPAMLEQARSEQEQRRLQNVSWHRGDILSLPYSSHTFSVVTSRFTLHHLLDPLAAVKEMKRVCGPGGRLVIADGCPHPAKAAALDMVERLRDPSHVRLRSEAELFDLFEAAGLPKPAIHRYRMEGRLDGLIARSFPEPGAAEKIREIFMNNLENDTMDMLVRRVGSNIVFGYPVAILASQLA